jgi:CRP/FNR family cyclic AMP-dependent transcriptional regulator
MSRRTELLATLAKVPLFSACSKRDLAIVVRHTEVITVLPGTLLTEEGALGDAFFVILEGRAAVGRRGSTVSRLGPGGWFGELAVLDPAPRDASVVAETPMTVGVIGARVFRAMVRDVPALTEKLLRGMARRLRDADLRQPG